ncbi:MAG TPA: bifunctional diaminohydroxyphosphoribosylaminopyrimidine deaminase/5-amino-6-(5-phosphoribosylamino)uracil reductase RibD [Acidimicrobiales bacterium]|nr:bifunctional diaminohydroxyphosphoribosylaminopyrimidine deaminase/5-amino-6-(5-phosphoribosylamino)uracil reductase RibD [Acidimicrobiales bacterium]
MTDGAADERFMRLAMANASTVRLTTRPNPWVGCVVVTGDGDVFQGATSEPGGPHAEIRALLVAGDKANGATLYATLEPCAHTGRTGPCVDAIIESGVRRVVLGIEDPDALVAGRGVARLRDAGIHVTGGVLAEEVTRQLAPYLTHRRTGRPHVVLKLALTLDGYIAAPDGSSTWITGAAARADAHRLRAESDAVVVGAGTVRADDPMLTVRNFTPANAVPTAGLDPLRVVLGRVPAGARVAPALEHQGDIAALLDDLGKRGVLQLMVEGGADVAGQFHRAGLVDEYVLYLAPAFMGGDRGRRVFAGEGAPTMAELTRGRFVAVDRLGDDLRIVVVVER